MTTKFLLKPSVFLMLGSLPDFPRLTLGIFSIRSIASGGLRDRVDFVIAAGEVGFFERTRKELFAVPTCPQLSSALGSWFAEFKENLPDVALGSARLRVGPTGERGVWLDFSNLDIKRLLDSKTWLEWALDRAVVEMGQKRKRVVLRDSRMMLSEPEQGHWIDTYFGDVAHPLYGPVGSFSQVGSAANQVLVETFLKLLPITIDATWLELGAGNGNFTVPLIFRGAKVRAVEIDAVAIAGLKKTIGVTIFNDAVQIIRKSFQNSTKEWEGLLENVIGIVADPPRSGLMGFLSTLAQIEKRPSEFYLHRMLR